MKQRTLVVDDNQNNLLLEIAGFEVFEAEEISKNFI